MPTTLKHFGWQRSCLTSTTQQIQEFLLEWLNMFLINSRTIDLPSAESQNSIGVIPSRENHKGYSTIFKNCGITYKNLFRIEPTKKNTEEIKNMRQHYAAFMLDCISTRVIWNFDRCIKIGMCSPKGWSVKGTLQETVAEGKNMTIFLGIWSGLCTDGEECLLQSV